MRPRVLVLAFSDLARDPRVDRQLRTLARDFDVHAAGWAPPAVPGVAFTRLAPERRGVAGRALSAVRLLARRDDAYAGSRSEVRQGIAALRGHGAALIVANDLESLPLALAVREGARILFDGHEYGPEEHEGAAFRLLLGPHRLRLLRRDLPRVDGAVTVCDGLAEAYMSATGVRPEVVWNAPPHEDLPPPEAPAEGPIRLVHHGGAQRQRRIEGMIAMMRHLGPGYELSLVLTGPDAAYHAQLRRLAAGDSRIRFLPPVPMTELPRFLHRFEVGVYLLPPTSFNNRHALPNKFFEFVQARLAVALGPSPEMARLVRAHDLGAVAEDFTPEALARAVASLDRDRIAHHRRRAHEAARALSAEGTLPRFAALAARLAAGGRA